MRRDSRISLTVLDGESWYRQVSLLGRVVSIDPDPELRDIDRLSVRYTGNPYARRDQQRWSAWIDIARWYGWVNGAPWDE